MSITDKARQEVKRHDKCMDYNCCSGPLEYLEVALDVVDAADKVGVSGGEKVYVDLFIALAKFKEVSE